jgi:alkylation response protein AidB-like acyl-CoA dehydrogenase
MADRATYADIGAWRDLVLSDERAELAASVRRHLAGRFPLSALRDAFDPAPGPLPGWDEIAASGYPLIGVPESAGGIGSLVDLAALLEEAGRALLSVPLLATVLSLHTRLAAGIPLDEGAGTVPAGLAVARAGQVAGGVLTASRVAVLDAPSVRRLTIALPDGLGTLLTDLDAAAVRDAAVRDAAGPPPSGTTRIDPGRPAVVTDLAGLPARAVWRVDASLDDVLAPARVAVAADLVGVAAGALDRSVRHALDREQFGRKLGAFQAVKHKLADVYVAVEGARSVTRAAAITLADPLAGPDARVLPLLAKAAAAEAALRATAAFVQVLGAMGVTFEADAHLYFRRAQQTAPFLGSAAQCYRRAVELRRDAR